MSEKKRIIRVDANGTVRALHYDDMDLGFLGPKQIGRASEILFNHDEQAFHVELPQLDYRRQYRGPDGMNFPAIERRSLQPKFLSGFRGYDEARRFEVFLLETCAKNHINPAYEGAFYRLANEIRTRFDNGDEGVFAWNGNSSGGSCPV